MGLMAMVLSATGLALPRLHEDIGLTSVQQGSLVSIQYAGFTVAVLLGGSLCDKYGKLKILSIAYGILGVAAILFGAASSYWMTVVGVVLIGAFGSIAQNGITSLATNYDKNNAEKNNTFVQLFFTVGAIITPVLLLIFMLKFNSWRYPYYIIAALSFVMAFITSRFKDESTDSNISLFSNFATYAKALRTPSYLIAPVALFMYVGAEIGIWGFAPIFLEGQGYGRISGILSSILIWLAMFLGRSISVKLLKKYDMRQILIVHGILAVISLICVIFSGQTASIIWISIAGFACAPFYPLIVTWMTRLTGEKSSSALAFTMASGSFGAVVVGWIIGLIVDGFGAKYITVAPTFTFIIVLLLLIFFGKRKFQE